MKLIKVLYNDACGDWSFSDEFFSEQFMEEFKKRYNREINEMLDSTRYDKNVIELFEEMGSKFASHENAFLKITNFPEKWIEFMEIRVYDGRENVSFSREKAYKQLLEQIMLTKTITDDVIEKYEGIDEIYKSYR